MSAVSCFLKTPWKHDEHTSRKRWDKACNHKRPCIKLILQMQIEQEANSLHKHLLCLFDAFCTYYPIVLNLTIPTPSKATSLCSVFPLQTVSVATVWATTANNYLKLWNLRTTLQIQKMELIFWVPSKTPGEQWKNPWLVVWLTWPMAKL